MQIWTGMPTVNIPKKCTIQYNYKQNWIVRVLRIYTHK